MTYVQECAWKDERKPRAVLCSVTHYHGLLEKEQLWFSRWTHGGMRTYIVGFIYVTTTARALAGKSMLQPREI